MLRPVVLMRDEEGARLFYGDGSFTRRGALRPRSWPCCRTVGGGAGRTGVERAHGGVAPGGRPTLLDEAQQVLCRAACEWADVPPAG
jgi:hypothetical protein